MTSGAGSWTEPQGDPSVRPRVHLTPPRGWLSDPNGLFHRAGRFHAYYQHHPHDTSWGPMHWGHASTTDLVTWQHHPIALAPDERGCIYSGSAVVDADDTAGFGGDALVAAFTHHRDGIEEQSLAWSCDGGETFTKLPAPVIEAPSGQRDFRDPRILRNPAGDPRWLMLLAVGRAIWIYASDDLRSWTRTGTVSDVFCEDGTWETPELLRFDADGSQLWVLVVAIGDGAPAGGSGVQAVAGDFDGSTFVPSADAFWVDHGPAFYAPQAWSSAPDGRRIWVGWMANWHTVNALPARGWRGQMSIPREVSLHLGAEGPRLVQSPVHELESYRERSLIASGDEVPALPSEPLPVVAAALDVVVHAAPGALLELRCRRDSDDVTIRLDGGRHEMAVAVSHAAHAEADHRAPLAADVPTQLRILLDAASVEAFAGVGTISALLPNSSAAWTVEVTSMSDASTIDRIELHELSSAPADPPAALVSG